MIPRISMNVKFIRTKSHRRAWRAHNVICDIKNKSNLCPRALFVFFVRRRDTPRSAALSLTHEFGYPISTCFPHRRGSAVSGRRSTKIACVLNYINRKNERHTPPSSPRSPSSFHFLAHPLPCILPACLAISQSKRNKTGIK